MRLLDRAFGGNRRRYVLQCVLSAPSMFVILAIFNSISNAAVIAALGASNFIVFVSPRKNLSRPRYLIGGYAVGLAVGAACFWLSHWMVLPPRLGLMADLPFVVFGASAAGLATFVMVITDTEHPPAAGASLGLVLLEQWSWTVPFAIMAAVVLLCLIKRLLKRFLMDLV